MNVKTSVSVPKTLREVLRQHGREWVVDRMLGEYTREELTDSHTRASLAQDIYRQIGSWATTDEDLQGTTLNMVRLMVNDFVARYHNIDPDGRTMHLPKNRAEEVQTSYGMGKKAITTVLHGGIAIDTWPDGTKSGRILVQHQVRFVREVSHEQLHPASHDHTVVFAVGDVADVARFVEGGAHVYTPSGDVVWVSNLTVVRI